jgi:hypothetical protein
MTEEVNDINALRGELFATIRALRDPASPMDINRAKAVAEVAGRVIDSVKAETEYVRTFGSRGSVPGSGFIALEHKDTLDRQAASTPVPGRGLPATAPRGSL